MGGWSALGLGGGAGRGGERGAATVAVSMGFSHSPPLSLSELLDPEDEAELEDNFCLLLGGRGSGVGLALDRNEPTSQLSEAPTSPPALPGLRWTELWPVADIFVGWEFDLTSFDLPLSWEDPAFPLAPPILGVGTLRFFPIEASCLETEDCFDDFDFLEELVPCCLPEGGCEEEEEEGGSFVGGLGGGAVAAAEAAALACGGKGEGERSLGCMDLRPSLE